MNLKLHFWIGSLLIFSALVLVACGGNQGGTSTTENGEASAEQVALSVPGEELVFDKTALTAKAGGKVSLTLKNGSAAQPHNWVLVKGGDDVAAQVAEAGIAAGDAKGYIPEGPNVLAHTKLITPGGSDTVEFTAPAAGTYTYLCTYPGHSATMKGTLTVQ